MCLSCLEGEIVRERLRWTSGCKHGGFMPRSWMKMGNRWRIASVGISARQRGGPLVTHYASSRHTINGEIESSATELVAKTSLRSASQMVERTKTRTLLLLERGAIQSRFETASRAGKLVFQKRLLDPTFSPNWTSFLISSVVCSACVARARHPLELL